MASEFNWSKAPLEVMKFGGTSVKDVERLKSVAERVKQRHLDGKKVVVIVSAMAGVTNSLVSYCKEIAPEIGDVYKERDTILASGEQVTSGLLTLRLTELGIKARSLQGWQIPLIFNRDNGAVSIAKESTDWLNERLSDGEVLVVAGFQGIDTNGAIATLGRGGSDASAVILAASLKADKCDIFTDVDGVYTADPRVVSDAGVVDALEYGEMLELSAAGAKVMQSHSIALAMQYGVTLRVLSSQTEGEGQGSMICHSDMKDAFIMKRACVSGVASTSDQAKLYFESLTDQEVELLFKSSTDMGIGIDAIQIEQRYDEHDLSICIQEDVVKSFLKKLSQEASGLKPSRVVDGLSKISIIGVAVNSHSSTLKLALATLRELKCPIYGVSANEMKVAFLVKKDYAKQATQRLHTAFGLQPSHK